MSSKEKLIPVTKSTESTKIDCSKFTVDKLGARVSSSKSIQKIMHRIDTDNQNEVESNETNTDNLDVESDSIIDDLFRRNHILQTKWTLLENKINTLNKENNDLKQSLTDEKHRSLKYLKKIQFIQDNQPIFEQLKQAYMSVKYNESSSRPMVEIKEKCCQTNSGFYDTSADSSSCACSDIEIEDQDNQFKSEYIPIKQSEFNDLKKTVQTLKTMIISQPLASFVLSEAKEAKYRKDITDLFKENQNLKQVVIDQQMQLDTTKKRLTIKKGSKEIGLLKNIIAKMELQIQSGYVSKDDTAKKDPCNCLSDKEMQIVEHITSKYKLKLLQKLDTSKSDHTSTCASGGDDKDKSVDEEKSYTPFCTPRTPHADYLDSFRSCSDNLENHSKDC